MSIGIQTGTLKRVIELSFQADDNGKFAGGGAIPAKPGDDIRFAFRGRAGSTPANLDLIIKGGAVESRGIAEVVQMTGGQILKGKSEMDAVLVAKQPGDSTVDLNLLDADGKITQALAFAVSVS
jgi:hypothetical protein